MNQIPLLLGEFECNFYAESKYDYMKFANFWKKVWKKKCPVNGTITIPHGHGDRLAHTAQRSM